MFFYCFCNSSVGVADVFNTTVLPVALSIVSL